MNKLFRTLPVALLALGMWSFTTTGCSGYSDDKPTNGQDSLDDSTADSTDDSTGDSTADSTLDSLFVVSGNGLLIDDFEDGDSKALTLDTWFTIDDNGAGGESKITNLTAASEPFMGSDAFYSKKAMNLKFTLKKAAYPYAPYVAVGLSLPQDASGLFDGSRFGGITVWYKGMGPMLRVETDDVADYDYHYYQIPTSRSWKKLTVDFNDLAQGGWGKAVKFDKSHLKGITFQMLGKDGQVDSFYVDNVYLEDTATINANVTQDYKINPAEEPARTDIGSITITTPMQTLAQKLDKGVNLTNWLEEAKPFSEWKYAEADIKRYADAGLKAVRLPIDFDQYLVDREAYLAATTDEMPMDEKTLFMVLDSFVDWTARYNMSLTIDYHQYDGSFTAASSTNPRYTTMMAKLWKLVAARYASNTRDDIFFELTNEPDDQIKLTTWTKIAQEMIDSIRVVDKEHAIIFGDVNWYSQDNLVKRTPFTDTKIIYAVHFYDPFAFTHQGASWADLTTLKNVPFPYDPARWSTTSKYFGVNASTPSWIKTQMLNYYKTGNENTLYNRLAIAKAWAVKNNVALICNEFGALNLSSTSQDILNYYTSLRKIFNALEIPWQHWGDKGGFSMFNDDGSLRTGMKDALGL